MKQDSLFKRNELFVCAGVLAAHSSAEDGGFRQRDVRFFIELFSNWIENILDEMSLVLSNTQVSRYLAALVDEGYARKFGSEKKPHYELTRTGLVEVLARITQRPFYQQPEFFFFLYYFVSSYRGRLIDLIEGQGSEFPSALKLEVEALLDVEQMVKRHIAHAEQELEKLDARIDESRVSSKLCTDLYQRSEDESEVFAALEAKHPYELNSQKPLTELMGDLPPWQRRWELETGSIRRVEHIWVPARRMVETYLEILRGFVG